MNLFSYKEFSPNVGTNVFMAQGSKIIGRCVLGDNVNIWFNSICRGDVNSIDIGENTNIQDLCMLHVTEKYDLKIGKNVSVGHSVNLHGCEIGDGSLIGIGAIVLDGAVIGKESIVAAGSIVPPGKKFDDGMMLMGSPAKATRALTSQERARTSNHYKSYIKYADEFGNQEIVKELT